MSLPENLRITESFIRSWQKNPARIEPEIASLSNETNQRPDRYFLEVLSQGKLADPETRQPIRVDTESYLGRKEFELLTKLQEAASNRDEGNFIWISPKRPGEYPCTKIIFHQIAYKPSGEKVLLCSAVLCKISNEEILEIAAWLSGKEYDIEELRTELFVVDEEKIVALWQRLLKFQNLTSSPVPKSEIAYFVEKIRRGDEPNLIAREMAQRGLLGEFSISCPTVGLNTFSELITNRLATYEQSGVCKKCGTTVGVVCGWCKKCWQRYGVS